MATGDGITTTKVVAARLGIPKGHGKVKPQDELQLVEQLQNAGRVVAMAVAVSIAPPPCPELSSVPQWVQELTLR